MIKQLIVGLALLFLFFGATAVAEPLPIFFYGDLIVGGEPAAVGTSIQAYIDGLPASEVRVVTIEGTYATSDYPLMVQLASGVLPASQTIIFMINGYPATTKGVHVEGITKRLDIISDIGPAQPRLNVIPKGGIVFLGEEGLDLSQIFNGPSSIYWFSPSQATLFSEPAAEILIPFHHSFFVSPEQFRLESYESSGIMDVASSIYGSYGAYRLGNWYFINEDGLYEVAFVVQDPSLTLGVWNQDSRQTVSVNGGAVPAGDYLNFIVKTNLYAAVQQRIGLNALEEIPAGIIHIFASGPSGMEYPSLQGRFNSTSLRNLPVTSDPWYWPNNDNMSDGWNTLAIDENSYRLYVNGIYTFYAIAHLNNIQNNYLVEGKTITPEGRIELVDDEVRVSVNEPVITRGESFTATVTGKPGKTYIMTIMETSPGSNPADCAPLKVNGDYCERPPIINSEQDGVGSKIMFDLESGPFYIGETTLAPNNCGTKGIIRSVIPTDRPGFRNVISNGVYYYALITTDSDSEPRPGVRTVLINTGPDMAPDITWKINVQEVTKIEGGFFVPVTKSKPGYALVTVNKGIVTVDVDTSETYLGSTLKLSGINTDSNVVYLYMTGAGQNACGNDILGWKRADEKQGIVILDPRIYQSVCVDELREFTAVKVPVRDDGTWEYYWETKLAPIDPGTYTVYAVSQPINACCLDCACAGYGEIVITLFKPDITAVLEPALIELPIDCCAGGCTGISPDAVTITGVATGFPHTKSGREINMWVFGDDTVGNQPYLNARVPVYGDDTFKANLLDYGLELCKLKPGCYSVILQHPMYNHQFDMVKETDVASRFEKNRIWMVTSYPSEWSKLFPLEGTGSFLGAAAVAEIEAFLSAGYVDDSYIVLQFCIIDDRVPLAAFSGEPTSGSAPLEVEFTDLSKGKNLVSWLWDLGDGTTSTVRNPTHTYMQPGEYTVSLTVITADGTQDTTIKPDYIKVRLPRITADFVAAPLTGMAPLTVLFTDRSTGSPTNWFWDFGDGGTAVGVKNPEHVYQYGGTYSVTLTVTLGEDVDRITKKEYITVEGEPCPPGPGPGPNPIDPSTATLYPGWNLISVPRTLDGNYNTAVIFENIPTGGHAIWSYNPYQQYWTQVMSDTIIEPLHGYWIYTTSVASIPLTFKNDPVAIPPSRNLPNGWSLIGFTGSTPATAKDTMSSVKNGWVYVHGWNAANQQWEPMIANGGQYENSYMYPTLGYWVYMDEPGTLAAIGA